MAQGTRSLPMEDRAAQGPTPVGLFVGFMQISLSGFGGVLAWAHRGLVERRHWLSDREFTEILGLAQALPGGNILNVSVFVGTRFCGLAGAVAAEAGLILAPLCLLLLINALLGVQGLSEMVRPALHGAAVAAAGMVIATGLKMARAYRRSPLALVVAAVALVSVGVLQVPLLAALVVLAPVSVALHWRGVR